MSAILRTGVLRAAILGVAMSTAIVACTSGSEEKAEPAASAPAEAPAAAADAGTEAMAEPAEPAPEAEQAPQT